MAAAQHAVVPEFTFGDRLRKAREHAGLSREELAETLGVNVKSLWNWEAGLNKPRNVVELAQQWADATGVPAEWLLGLSSQSTSEFGPSLTLVYGEIPEQLRLPKIRT